MNNNRIDFDAFTGAVGCCGAFEISQFSQESYYGYGAHDRQLASHDDVFKRFDADLKARVNAAFETKRRGAGYQGLITLVRRYGRTKKHQFPEFEKHLLEKGWTEVAEWKNQNTGNTCVLLTKFLTRNG